MKVVSVANYFSVNFMTVKFLNVGFMMIGGSGDLELRVRGSVNVIQPII